MRMIQSGSVIDIDYQGGNLDVLISEEAHID
jgi:hypothetical protein